MDLLWNFELGNGVIDCALTGRRKTLVAGDVTGSLAILDYQGRQLAQFNHDMPVWGVDIDDDAELVAIGLASKQPYRGSLVVRQIQGGKVVLDHRTSSPVWDVLIAMESSRIFATSWHDGLICYDLNSGTIDTVSSDHPLFGLSRDNQGALGRLFVTSSNEGLYETKINEPTSLRLISRATTACYNNLFVSNSNSVLYGSSTNILSQTDLGATKDLHTPTLMRSLSSMAVMHDLLYCGDLDGNFSISRIESPASPIHYQHFPESIWNIATDNEASLIFIACGDGRLYCYDVAGELKENIHLYRDRVNIDRKVLRDTRIFISYASEDHESARMLYGVLKSAGCRPWLDRIDLLPGQDWKFEIESAIKLSDFCVLCLSKRSVAKRGFVQNEMKRALEILDQMPEGQSFLLPVRLDDCEVPSAIAHRHWVNVFEEDGIYKLLLAIYLERLKNRQ